MTEREELVYDLLVFKANVEWSIRKGKTIQPSERLVRLLDEAFWAIKDTMNTEEADS